RDICSIADGPSLRRVGTSQRAYHHASAMDADAYLEVDLGGGELPDSLHHFERASNCARRIVLVGDRIAEIDLDAISAILGDKAIVAEHDGIASALVGTHHNTQILRVQPLGQRSRAHKIAEQHAHTSS